jgi:hypothetical protein
VESSLHSLNFFLDSTQPLCEFEQPTKEGPTKENATEGNATKENATKENATKENATRENATKENATKEKRTHNAYGHRIQRGARGFRNAAWGDSMLSLTGEASQSSLAATSSISSSKSDNPVTATFNPA